MCCSVNTELKGWGVTTNTDRDEFFKVGCLCAEIGIVEPTTLFGYSMQSLCCYSVVSLPCGDKEYIPAPVCGVCFFQCFPEFGCCVAPPPCPALDNVDSLQPQRIFDRGEFVPHHGGSSFVPTASIPTDESSSFLQITEQVALPTLDLVVASISDVQGEPSCGGANFDSDPLAQGPTSNEFLQQEVVPVAPAD
jgi:hypothetical protein